MRGERAAGIELPPRPLVELARVGRGDYRGRIEALVPCPADRAWSRLRRLDDLHRLIPFCEHSTTHAPDARGCELEIRIGFPTPLPTVHYRVRCDLDDEARCVRWWRITGNLSRNDGSLCFDPIDAGRCRARYECTVGVGFHVPRLAEKLVERAVLPRVIRHLAHGVDGA